MARLRERYGSGVAGLPLWARLVLSAAVLAPATYFGVISVQGALGGSMLTAITFAFTVLFASPAYLVLPSLWRRTEESVRSDWRSTGVERRLALELRDPDVGPVAPLAERPAPPSRW